jgi:hypothetical protein
MSKQIPDDCGVLLRDRVRRCKWAGIVEYQGHLICQHHRTLLIKRRRSSEQAHGRASVRTRPRNQPVARRLPS